MFYFLLNSRVRMPESRSSCWMTFSLGMAGLGVVMGITVFFVFRSVVTPLNEKGSFILKMMRYRFFIRFLIQLSVRQHPRWSVGAWEWDSCCHRSPLAPPLPEPQVVQLLSSSLLSNPSFIQASHMAHRAQPCCQQEPRPSHLSIQVFTWSLINFLLALYGAQFSLAHLEISHPTQSNLIYLNKLASLGATLVRNYDPLTDLLTGVKCRATSVAKNI